MCVLIVIQHIICKCSIYKSQHPSVLTQVLQLTYFTRPVEEVHFLDATGSVMFHVLESTCSKNIILLK